VNINTEGLPELTVAKLEATDVTTFTTMTAHDVDGDGLSDVLMGAPTAAVGLVNPGQAYLFMGSGAFGDKAASGAASTFTGKSDLGMFGSSVNTAGDVNADGYADIIIGGPYYNNGVNAVGAAYLFLGSSTGIASCDLSATCTPTAMYQGSATDAGFGEAVTAGDINDDGYDDVVIGAPIDPIGNGYVYIYHGGPALTGTLGTGDADAAIEGETDKSSHGAALDASGDVNGDGINDIVIGAPELDVGTQNGKVYVFIGSATGIASCRVGTNCSVLATISAQAANDDDYVGNSVANGGDVNDDGYYDVLIGAPNSTASNNGRAHLFLGGPTLAGDLYPANSDATITGANNDDDLGASVAFAGDTNGDGIDDIVVGATQTPSTDDGYSCIFKGGATLTGSIIPSSLTGACLYGGTTGDRIGESVNTAADLNGDDYDDVLIGARGAIGNKGRVYILTGSATGVADCDISSCTPFGTVTGIAPGDQLARVK